MTDTRRCIDIGCGPGNSTKLILDRFPKAIVTGLDNSPSMLSKARERLRGLTFEEADLTEWWPDGRFDLIFASGILQWLPDQQRILTRLVSFLHDGGCLAVQVPKTIDDPPLRLMEEVAIDGPWARRVPERSPFTIPVCNSCVVHSIFGKPLTFILSLAMVPLSSGSRVRSCGVT